MENTLMQAIVTENLTKKFGELTAVDNLNLQIPHGVTFGLLGPNGAGKTTTVRMINCIIKPTSGRAFVNDFNILTNPQQVKAISGFLPESPGLYEKLTCVEFLEFIGELYSVPNNILKDRIEELVELFELKGRENDLLEGYSRGMKQKICLMSAIIHDPKVIFLDEPTSNLDPEAAHMVRDLIQQLAKKADKTIFLCTHLLKHAEELCDIIGIIKEGKLIIEGDTKKIIEETGTKDLESAYLKLIGKVREEDLIGWRK
ncbi:MAG: ABC transporter ATP-binding protein [Candidatus Helarchaeota archaeon]